MFALDGTSLLHHPSLDEFTLLTGITTVDDALGIFVETTDDFELLSDTLVVLESDAELLGNDGEPDDAPCLPSRVVFVGVLEFTKVAERPRHLIAISLPVALTGPTLVGSKYLCDALRYARFLGDTNLHDCRFRIMLIIFLDVILAKITLFWEKSRAKIKNFCESYAIFEKKMLSLRQI